MFYLLSHTDVLTNKTDNLELFGNEESALKYVKYVMESNNHYSLGYWEKIQGCLIAKVFEDMSYHKIHRGTYKIQGFNVRYA